MNQFDARFLAVTLYPQWVTNVVPVPKKDDKVRMCVYHRDLNRASPKDNFSGYNQIKMVLEDMEKTTFVTLGHFLLQIYAIWVKERRGNLSTCYASIVS